MAIGALAAVAALWVLAPNDGLAPIATAVLAVSVGLAVFRSVQDRLLAAMAVANLSDVTARSARLANELAALEAKLGKLKQKAADGRASGSPGGAAAGVDHAARDSPVEMNGLSTGTEGVLPEDFGGAERILGRAEGDSGTIASGGDVAS